MKTQSVSNNDAIIKSSLGRALVAAVAVLIPAGLATAQDYQTNVSPLTWENGGAGWTVSDVSTPYANNLSETATFLTGSSVTISGTVQAGRIRSFATLVTLTGGQLEFGTGASNVAGTGAIRLQTTASSEAANAAFVNQGSGNWLIGSSGTLTTGASTSLRLGNVTYVGRMTVENGGLLTLNSTGDHVIGDGSGTTSALQIESTGTLDAAGSLRIGTGGVTGSVLGTLTVNGTATVKGAGNSITFGASTDNASVVNGGTINLTAGTLRANGISSQKALNQSDLNFSGGTLGAWNSNMNVGSATAANNITMTLNGSTGVITSTDGGGVGRTVDVFATIGESSAGSGFTVSGLGTVALHGNNNYSGPTTVSSGTLRVSNTSGSATGSGNISVASGAVLEGNGSIGGNLTIGGSLRPGNSIGELTVSGDVTWDSGNAWVFELDTAAATQALAAAGASTQDFLSIGEDFLKGTGTAWTFDFAGGGQAGWFKLAEWTGGTTFATGLSSQFLATNLADTFTGEFTVDSGALYLNVIPEPSSMLLLFGAMGMMWTRRRRARLNS